MATALFKYGDISSTYTQPAIDIYPASVKQAKNMSFCFRPLVYLRKEVGTGRPGP